MTAIVVATVFAQKGENVAANLHESTRIQIRDNPCQSVDKTLAGERPAALNAEESEERRHGEASTDFTDLHGSGAGASTNLHESTQISIRDDSCQFVDETTLCGLSATPNAEVKESGRHGETTTDFTDSHGSGEGGFHESTRIDTNLKSG